jgi:hypothetical protein
LVVSSGKVRFQSPARRPRDRRTTSPVTAFYLVNLAPRPPGHPSAPIGARFPRGLRRIDNGCLGVIFRKKLTPVLSAG